MARPVHVLVLAGGVGSRMKSQPLPKVLIGILGRPVIGHVIEAARAVRPAGLVVVGGAQLELVQAALADEPCLKYARQPRPLGTGDAVKKALAKLPRSGADVLILYGDMPLLRGKSLRQLLTQHRRRKSALTVISAEVTRPEGLGRIVRDTRGRFLRIVEHQDASPEERAIREVNAGGFLLSVQELRRVLPRLKRSNQQGELYLTDVVPLVSGKVCAWPLPDPAEAMGINHPAELVAVKRLLRRRILEEHMARGVLIEDPDLTLIESGVRIGRGAQIAPFAVIRRGVTIAARCQVGPFAHLESKAVSAGIVSAGSRTTRRRTS